MADGHECRGRLNGMKKFISWCKAGDGEWVTEYVIMNVAGHLPSSTRHLPINGRFNGLMSQVPSTKYQVPSIDSRVEEPWDGTPCIVAWLGIDGQDTSYLGHL